MAGREAQPAIDTPAGGLGRDARRARGVRCEPASCRMEPPISGADGTASKDGGGGPERARSLAPLWSARLLWGCGHGDFRPPEVRVALRRATPETRTSRAARWPHRGYTALESSRRRLPLRLHGCDRFQSDPTGSRGEGRTSRACRRPAHRRHRVASRRVSTLGRRRPAGARQQGVP